MPTDITQSVDESETEKLKTTIAFDSSKESEPTLATDNVFDVTTEQSDVRTTSPDSDEYEIVPATTCEDGEWVESDEPWASINIPYFITNICCTDLDSIKKCLHLYRRTFPSLRNCKPRQKTLR